MPSPLNANPVVVSEAAERIGFAIEAEMKKSNMKDLDRWFVKLSFKTFLKSGAYTKEGFEELIVQTSFAKHAIIEYGLVFRYGSINEM